MLKLVVLTVLLVTHGLEAASRDAPAEVSEADSSPNILLIVADDLGFSDIGAFGGEISTPNLDELANRGMRLSNFRTGPTCSVSRSMLMSGVDSHIAGLGNMAETVADNQMGLPGYEGHLNNRVDTIAEVLKSAGYHTYMSGKWHLGMDPEHSPRSRGFDRSFALLYGGGSHYADMAGSDVHRNPVLYRSNGSLVSDLPKDFYSSSYYTDTLIKQIETNIDDEHPFFAYLAFTAPHWPLQAPRETIDKYRGRYDQGYDIIRESRFAAQINLGLFPASTPAPQRPASLNPWSTLSEEDRRAHAGTMEIYAAMVDYMDMSIGRVVDYLSSKGELNNTVIVFMSDNGAEQWDQHTAPPSVGKFASTFDNSAENRGQQGSFVFYGQQWAHVSNTPFTRFKGSMYEGGIRSPAIVVWPGRTSTGHISPALTFITDWYATFAELGGVASPNTSGKSLVPLLTGAAERVRADDEAIGVELWGGRGVVREQYKLVSASKMHGDGRWELYDLENDPGEQINLVDEKPKVFAAMREAWSKYASDNNVILPEGPFTVRPPSKKPLE